MSKLISTIFNHFDFNSKKLIVIDSKNNWTWSDLFDRSKYYSDIILNNFSQKKVIPILVNRSGETIAAILACVLLKKGFSPISPDQPKDRIERQLLKLKSSFLLSTFETELTFNNIGVLNVNNSQSPPKILYEKTEFYDEDILYILFTSGSTGEPKGVIVSSKNIENTIIWSKDMIDWNQNDIIGCSTNFYFDISMFDIFTSFYLNIPLAILSETNKIKSIIDEIYKFKITSIFSVPLFFSQFLTIDFEVDLEKLKTLRRILSGGDFFNTNHILKWMKFFPSVKVYNVWGPTETSIVNTMYLITEKDRGYLNDGKSPSVGFSHPKMSFFLVDESRKNIVSKSFKKGEVVMSGDCVTKGYLDDVNLTKQSYKTIGGIRSFYTNDLGYIDDTGNLFITGRKDTLVKISGYRVDLREIESTSLTFENIENSIAFKNKINEFIDEIWIGILLMNKELKFNIFEFKQFLREKLPQYMIPKRVKIIDEMILNKNGKIDRKNIIIKLKTDE